MSDENDHRQCVDAWLARCTSESPSSCVDAFERAFSAIWARAGLTLGEVTLAAIVDRVLVTTAAEHPAFASLRLEAGGRVHCDELRAASREPAELRAGMGYALLELLTVVGNLTGEVLTPVLHAELRKTADTHGTNDEGETS